MTVVTDSIIMGLFHKTSPHPHRHKSHFPHPHMPHFHGKEPRFETYTLTLHGIQYHACTFHPCHHHGDQNFKYCGHLLPDTCGQKHVDVEVFGKDVDHESRKQEQGMRFAQRVLNSCPRLQKWVRVVDWSLTRVDEVDYTLCLCHKTVHKEDIVMVLDVPHEKDEIVKTFPICDVNNNLQKFRLLDPPHYLTEFVKEARKMDLHFELAGKSSWQICGLTAVIIHDVCYLTSVEIRPMPEYSSAATDEVLLPQYETLSWNSNNSTPVYPETRLMPTAPEMPADFNPVFQLNDNYRFSSSFLNQPRCQSLLPDDQSNANGFTGGNYALNGNSVAHFSNDYSPKPAALQHDGPPPSYSEEDPYPR